MIKEAIGSLMAGDDLDFDTARQSMQEIMAGKASDAQIAAFLTALRIKGETIDEITAFAEVMRECGFKLESDRDVVEIVGTGGDEAFTFNISTVSAFVMAAAGLPVAKHGNRSVSSKCGAADVLEALGARIDLSPEESKKVLDQTGMCFLFAPVYHSSMKYAAPVRREMGVRTVFNILGPLASPAAAKIQLLGVYDEQLAEPLLRVLCKLGVKRAMSVHGNDGLDEISLASGTKVFELRDGNISCYEFDPREIGFELCRPQDLRGGDAERNAQIAKAVLSGEKGAKRDIVLINAGACLYLAGLCESIKKGTEMAAQLIDSGKAMDVMLRFVSATNKVRAK